jgi:hypothetical protein
LEDREYAGSGQCNDLRFGRGASGKHIVEFVCARLDQREALFRCVAFAGVVGIE